jgi:short-subunit dehydrogenase
MSTASLSSRPLALVTGASSGIGRDLAVLLAEAGYALVLVARGEAAMQVLAADLERRYGTPALILAVDLADPGAASRIMAALEERRLSVEILINNAGFGLLGRFHENDAAALTRLLNVNMLAPTELARALLPGMIARGRGRILNVASIAAMQPGPLMAAYYASKAYLLSLSEALWEETRGTGVTITALCPGPVETDFARRGGFALPRLGRLIHSSDWVARQGFAGMMRGRRIVIPGLANQLTAFAPRLLPRGLPGRIVRRIQANLKRAG